MVVRARLIAAVTAVLIGAACSGTPDRKTPGPGDVFRVVGGGDQYLANLHGTWGATEINELNTLVALAVEPDGTLWLVTLNGNVYRVDTEGRMSLAREAGAPRIARMAAAAVSPDGVLYLVSDASRVVTSVDMDDPGRERGGMVPKGLPTGLVGFTGVTVGPDGTLYAADGRSGIVYRIGGDGRAVAVPGTPDAQCLDVRNPAAGPYPVGLAVTAGRLVVADSGCRGLYHPGAGLVADPFGCRNPISGANGEAQPTSVTEAAGRLVFGDRHCMQVWRISSGGGETLVGHEDLSGAPHALGADRDGTVYALDDEGVVAVRPPGRASHG